MSCTPANYDLYAGPTVLNRSLNDDIYYGAKYEGIILYGRHQVTLFKRLVEKEYMLDDTIASHRESKQPGMNRTQLHTT